MIRSRVAEEAERLGLTLGALTRKSGASSSAVRRLWYSTSDGRSVGPPLESIHIPTLEALARALGIANPLELLEYVEE